MAQQSFEFSPVDYTEQKKLLPAGEILRNKKLQQVLENAGDDWANAAYQHIAQNYRGKLVTGELVRQLCEDVGIVPHHHNAWGGLIFGMVACGLLEDTGDESKMMDPRSHARKTSVYKVTPNVGEDMSREEIVMQMLAYEDSRDEARKALLAKHASERKAFDEETKTKLAELKQQAKEAK